MQCSGGETTRVEPSGGNILVTNTIMPLVSAAVTPLQTAAVTPAIKFAICKDKNKNKNIDKNEFLDPAGLQTR